MTIFSDIDDSVVRERFNRGSFRFRHNLADHDLFALDSLVALASRLPGSSVEYNPGDLGISHDPAVTPTNGLSVEDTVARIETCESWVALKNVEQDPAYGELLADCLDELAGHAHLADTGMQQHEAFIFISSPGAMTPFHIDPENNFLLQMRGTKTMRLFDREDRSVVRDEHFEGLLTGGHRNLDLDDEHADRGESHHLEPGDVLHVPTLAPHYVENGPSASVSFSVTFQTDESLRRQGLHRFNKVLRSMRLSPSPVGASPSRDRLKHEVLDLRRRLPV